MVKKTESVEIEIRLPEEVRRGVYVSDMYVTQTRDDVVFDFVAANPGPPHDREGAQAEVVSRVIVSYSLARRIKALFEGLDFAGLTNEDIEEAQASMELEKGIGNG